MWSHITTVVKPLVVVQRGWSSNPAYGELQQPTPSFPQPSMRVWTPKKKSPKNLKKEEYVITLLLANHT